MTWGERLGLFTFLLFMLGIMYGVYWLSQNMEARRNAFMKECQDDGKKHYECQALYGQAHKSDTTIVYVPVNMGK